MSLAPIFIPTEDMILMYESGMTHAQIARIAGVTTGSVTNRLRRAGYRSRPRGRQPA